jgi:hypothetical protein
VALRQPTVALPVVPRGDDGGYRTVPKPRQIDGYVLAARPINGAIKTSARPVLATHRTGVCRGSAIDATAPESVISRFGRPF